MSLTSALPTPPENPVLAAEMLGTVAGDLTLCQAFSRERISTRLQNVVFPHEFGANNLADVLLKRPEVDLVLRRLPNVGRKTVNEFWGAVGSSLARRLHDLGADENYRVRLAQALAIDATILHLHASEALLTATTAGSGGLSVRTEDLVELAGRAINRLPAREGSILRRRFARFAEDRETLEQIGSDLGVTRERIRQIEARALTELRRQLSTTELRTLLQSWGPNGWDALAGSMAWLRSNELSPAARNLHGLVLLLIALAELSVEAWLNAVAFKYPSGWLSPRANRKSVESLAVEICHNPALQRLPRAVESFGPLSEAGAALILTKGLYVDGGYVFASRPTPRRRRAAATHAVLSGSTGPIPLMDLHLAYRRLVPEDSCSPRDLLIVMEDARHLFLETAEAEWTALGRGGARPSWPCEVCGEEDVPDVSEEIGVAEPDLTIADALRREFARTGPQSIGELMGRASRVLPAGRSRHSIGPTLIGRPELFVRLLPGVYGLPDQTPTAEALLTASLPYLLNESQARLYIYARRADEPWGAFPMWRPEVEMRLCQWALSTGANMLYRSLLAIAEVDAWPADNDVRAEWRDLKRRHARHELVSYLRAEAIAELPTLDRLLAALVDLRTRGRTSWVRLNRVLGRRIDVQTSCCLLATLIALGAAHLPSGDDLCPWQLPHRLSSEAGPWADLLSNERHLRGSIQWSDSIGQELAHALLVGRERLPKWADPTLFTRLYSFGGGHEPPTEDDLGTELVAGRRMREFLDWLEVP